VTLLVVSPDYASHLFPLLALAGPWAAAGERVVVATGPAVAEHVERAGFERAPLVLGRGSNAGTARASDQPAGEDENLRAFFAATRNGMIATLRLQAELRRNDLLWEPLAAARATIDVVRTVRPDAILVDHLAFGAVLGLRAAGIPYADVVLGHPTALPVGDERYGVPPAWPRAFDPDPAELTDLRDLATEVSRRFTDDWNAALRTLDPGAAAEDDAFRAHGDAVLFSYPEALHDPARTALLPPVRSFLGSSVRDESLDAQAAAWLAAGGGRPPAGGDRPLVVVSFGSFLSARDDVLSRVAAALREVVPAAGRPRVALATGSADPAVLGALPGEWLVRPFLPQVALVRHAALAITHAGNNGVTEALAAGVPLVVLPFSTDQFAVAADVERAGLGQALDPNAATVDEIAGAIRLVLDGPAPGRAARLGATLRADPGPARARRALEALTAGPAG
jgi:UDP:flavonoid glycosyltransferase YjiC (YdhE family)